MASWSHDRVESVEVIAAARASRRVSAAQMQGVAAGRREMPGAPFRRSASPILRLRVEFVHDRPLLADQLLDAGRLVQQFVPWLASNSVAAARRWPQ